MKSHSKNIDKIVSELASEQRVIPECPKHFYQKGGILPKVPGCEVCQQVDYLHLVVADSTPQRRDERLFLLHGLVKKWTERIERGEVTSSEQLFQTPKISIESDETVN